MSIGQTEPILRAKLASGWTIPPSVSHVRVESTGWSVILDQLRQGLCVFDGDRRLVKFNHRFAEIYDLDASDLRLGMTFHEIVELHTTVGTRPPMTADEIRQWVDLIASQDRLVEAVIQLHDGRFLEINHVPLPDGGWVATYDDITDRVGAEETLRASEAALRESQERLALAIDAASDALWDWEIGTGDVWYSDRWKTMLGYAPSDLEPRIETWRQLVHPDDVDRATALLTAHFEGRSGAYECEHRLRRKDGDWGWVLARGKVVARDPSNAPLRMVGTHIDIGARRAAEARAAHMACHDSLTDLPNRSLFRDRLDQKLAHVRRHGTRCAVLCLDLDRFKAVNDTLGHLAGDNLLSAVARRLKAVLRTEDTVARIGGDEFAVLLDDANDPFTVEMLADRLIRAAEEPVSLGDQKVEVGLSIGIAVAPDHGTAADELLRRADLALYLAKAEGRNTYRFFDPAMDRILAERRGLESDLRHAFQNDELVLHYQPLVRSATGKVVGFEALIRWKHPKRGLVLPGTFVPLAEESGLIVELGEWVLRTACREAAR